MAWLPPLVIFLPFVSLKSHLSSLKKQYPDNYLSEATPSRQGGSGGGSGSGHPSCDQQLCKHRPMLSGVVRVGKEGHLHGEFHLQPLSVCVPSPCVTCHRSRVNWHAVWEAPRPSSEKAAQAKRDTSAAGSLHRAARLSFRVALAVNSARTIIIEGTSGAASVDTREVSCTLCWATNSTPSVATGDCYCCWWQLGGVRRLTPGAGCAILCVVSVVCAKCRWRRHSGIARIRITDPR